MGFLNNIPKPLLILGVFLIGIVFMVYTNRPHDLCDSQLENFQELEKGYLTPMPVKDHGTRAPIYDRAYLACRDGMGSAGACLEYFKILSKIVADLDPLAPSCGEYVAEVGVIRKSLSEGMRILVLIAWGEELPEKDAHVQGRLDGSELALFCRLKSTYLRYYERDTYEGFRSAVIAELPTKKFEMKDGKRECTNCEAPPKLIELMGSRDEILKHTIFALNCQAFN